MPRDALRRIMRVARRAVASLLVCLSVLSACLAISTFHQVFWLELARVNGLTPTKDQLLADGPYPERRARLEQLAEHEIGAHYRVRVMRGVVVAGSRGGLFVMLSSQTLTQESRRPIMTDTAREWAGWLRNWETRPPDGYPRLLDQWKHEWWFAGVGVAAYYGHVDLAANVRPWGVQFVLPLPLLALAFGLYPAWRLWRWRRSRRALARGFEVTPPLPPQTQLSQ